MSDGTGCECYASNASECCCDNVDWRSAREIELEVENAQLRKQLAAALAAGAAKDTVLQGIAAEPDNKFIEPAYVRLCDVDAAKRALDIKPDASALKAHDEALIRRCAAHAKEALNQKGPFTCNVPEEILSLIKEL